VGLPSDSSIGLNMSLVSSLVDDKPSNLRLEMCSFSRNYGEAFFEGDCFRCPLRSRKGSKGTMGGGVEGGISKDVGNETQGKGRKSHISLAQNKAICEVIERKPKTLEGVVRVRHAPIKIIQ
jgi:hypothetical protein